MISFLCQPPVCSRRPFIMDEPAGRRSATSLAEPHGARRVPMADGCDAPHRLRLTNAQHLLDSRFDRSIPAAGLSRADSGRGMIRRVPLNCKSWRALNRFAGSDRASSSSRRHSSVCQRLRSRPWGYSSRKSRARTTDCFAWTRRGLRGLVQRQVLANVGEGVFVAGDFVVR